MTDNVLQTLFKQGEELFGLLELETATCLKTLETITADDLTQFLVRRQYLVHKSLEFDAKLITYLSDSSHFVSLSDMSAINDFKHHFSMILQRIMRMEGLLRALAEQKMILISDEIDSLSRGLKALHGYQSGKDIKTLRDFTA